MPEIENLSKELKEKYDWLPNISITFMEFLHGVLRTRNKNACFFLRTKDSLDNIPVDYNDKFYETNNLSKLQLKVFIFLNHIEKYILKLFLKILKEKLKEYFPNQLFEYSARYDGIDKSTGRDKVKLTDMIEFGQIALKFLISSIERTYPDIKPIIKKMNQDDQHKYDFNDDVIKEG